MYPRPGTEAGSWIMHSQLSGREYQRCGGISRVIRGNEMGIEVYASATSVRQGEDIGFHASDDATSLLRIAIYEVGGTGPPIFMASGRANHYASPERAYETGCGWPTFCTVNVPLAWRSGLYRAILSDSKSSRVSENVFFVVTSASPGRSSPILLQFASATYQAYNSWGGKSLYPSDSPERARKVSFNRPGGMDYIREIGFLCWMRVNGLPVECCTSIDLHENRSLLDGYRLLLSVGHDEYWSKEMRDNVESFIAKGGNVAFFSGNVCWWQIRFEDGNRTMVCFKSAVEDPLMGVDNARVTVNWHSAPVNRPENSLTGVSFRNGAGIWQACNSSMDSKAYRVHQAAHWVFEGTGLCDGDLFGLEEKVIGYETDAADFFVDPSGNLRLSGRDGTPSSFVVLATADLSDWGPCGKAGRATMGVFHRTGTVFTAATTDWVRGFLKPLSAIHRITRNVIEQLRQPYPSCRWEAIGSTADIVAMAAMEGKLFAVTRQGYLLSRDPVGQNIKWTSMGSTLDSDGEILYPAALAAGENLSSNLGHRLYLASRSGMLFGREPTDENLPWEAMGEATDVVALAATNGHLFAARQDGKLWWRRFDPGQIWDRVDTSSGVVAMTALNGALFAAMADGGLWWRQPVGMPADGSEASWCHIGQIPTGSVAIAAVDGKLFTATGENVLWWGDVVAI
jgi:hypothetical protein